MIRTIILAGVMANGVCAQEAATDAFGILPTAHLGDRANWAGLRGSSTGEDVVQTAGPAEATVLFVGPKSIVAGIEPGHAVALGLDIYGNMLDGAQAQFTLGYGAGLPAETTRGIVDTLFTPPPRSGVFLAGAEVGGVQSARADYRVTAHLATVQPQFIAQDGRILPETFGQIASEPLVDAYGNPVDDGVGVSIFLRDGAGTATFLPSVVRDATAQSTLLARAITGNVAGQMALAGTSAGGLSFDVEPMVVTDAGDILIWSEAEINATHLRVGPMATDKGYLVPDGTALAIEIMGGDGAMQPAQGWVLDGYAAFVFLLDPQSGPFDVTLTLSDTKITRQVSVAQPPLNATLRGAE